MQAKKTIQQKEAVQEVRESLEELVTELQSSLDEFRFRVGSFLVLDPNHQSVMDHFMFEIAIVAVARWYNSALLPV